MNVRGLRGTATLALCWCALLVGGCKATPPGKWETAFITGAEHKFMVGDKDVKNPFPASAENIGSGKESFSHYCVACHGLDGQNTGVPFAEKMSPPVPSLASSDAQAFTDGQLKWIVDYGLSPSGMPGSKGILTDEEIWDTVLYIRHLPKAGSLGEPSVYSGEDCTSESEGDPPAKRPHTR
jgi:S-disulfanyl-L-cysteine oxidoreductase SoxD